MPVKLSSRLYDRNMMGGVDSTDWAHAGCKNDLPLPCTAGGRPTYASMLACCKGAYASQVCHGYESCTNGLHRLTPSSPASISIQDVWGLPEPARVPPHYISHLNRRVGCILPRLRQSLDLSHMYQCTSTSKRTPNLCVDA